jgi:hypothetical protein
LDDPAVLLLDHVSLLLSHPLRHIRDPIFADRVESELRWSATAALCEGAFHRIGTPGGRLRSAVARLKMMSGWMVLCRRLGGTRRLLLGERIMYIPSSFPF